MKPKIYIDGKDGTTGLQIYDRLGARGDIELLLIDEEKRKDAAERKKLLNAADIVFLCLPDDAAREAVALVENTQTRVIDASTAHRTAPGWDYGFPELSPARRAAIAASKRVANPGCYATGMLAIAAPLVALGILAPDYPLTVHAVSGYSGAGKKGIAQYEAATRAAELDSPRQYALSQAHKHLPEMQKIAGLTRTPIFNPYICDFYAGMTVSVPLYASGDAIFAALSVHYEKARFVKVLRAPEDGFIPATGNTGTNLLTVYVCGDGERTTAISLLDNLGKGASGAAVQNMNIMLGIPEDTSL
ncbi:MAG: N-acetyl-gamma-glutamyl-phosphate reductase [Oscillospiraceae bacterium]|jgi:N-acetyl-gamma-glutamyl-phosphate reductase|nr:N-acetyl-gamma-glutamyl-phosphate reductase [Oscillospiraceae bacterium]